MPKTKSTTSHLSSSQEKPDGSNGTTGGGEDKPEIQVIMMNGGSVSNANDDHEDNDDDDDANNNNNNNNVEEDDNANMEEQEEVDNNHEDDRKDQNHQNDDEDEKVKEEENFKEEEDVIIEQEEEEEEAPEDQKRKAKTPSPGIQKSSRELRSSKRKRGRSNDTTGMMAPEQQKQQFKQKQQQQHQGKPRASKRTRTTLVSQEEEVVVVAGTSTPPSKAQQKQPPAAAAVAIANGNGRNIATSVSHTSPAAAALDPRRISYAAAAATTNTNTIVAATLPLTGQIMASTATEKLDQAPSHQDNHDDDELMIPPSLPFPSAIVTTNTNTSTTNGAFEATVTIKKTTQEMACDNEEEEEEIEAEETYPMENEQYPTNYQENNGTGIAMEYQEELLLVEQAEMETATTIYTDIPDPTVSRLIGLVFTVGLSLLLLVVWPTMVMICDILIPLDQSLLLPPPPPFPVPILETPSHVEEEDQRLAELAEERETWYNGFIATLDHVRNLDTDLYQSNSHLRLNYHHTQETFQGLLHQLQFLQQSTQEKLNELTVLENWLTNNDHADQEDQERWRIMLREVVQFPRLDTSSIALWNIPDANEETCRPSQETELDDDSSSISKKWEDSLVTKQLLKEKESELLLRAQMSAEKFMSNRSVQSKVRQWITPIIQNAIGSVPSASETIHRIPELVLSLSSSSSSTGKETKEDKILALVQSQVSEVLLKIHQTISDRLEVDRADSTGLYDHASLRNGASILYGGKRGTSKSLIDYLPLFNRLLHKAQFRFYGFGPEVALTSTYPLHAVGQCWSFPPPSLKEQLADREWFRKETGVPDDFKRGSLGTLTIQLSAPVYVTSMVLEHSIPPSQRITTNNNRADSAVRSFRVVGYEDDAASTKAWNLGAFEYILPKVTNQHQYLQEFHVATTAYGNDIPALQSISLAIDSNWGNDDYTCMYRFRVHGTWEEEEEEEEEHDYD
jgi:hypothetical protein